MFLIAVSGWAQDIIVLNNGNLLKTNILEIGLSEIRYRRFEQTEGPVYSMSKAEIFAIHYKDGTKDTFGKGDVSSAMINKNLALIFNDTTKLKAEEKTFMKRKAIIHLAVGLSKLYSPVNEIGVNDYKIKTIDWSFDFGFGFGTNIVTGFSYGRSSYFAEQTFSDQYQFTETKFSITQKIQSFAFWGRYYIPTRNPKVFPYATLGLSVNRSDVSETITTKTDQETIKFDRGGKLMDLIPLTKIGVEYYWGNNIGFFSEIGYGVTLINLGFTFSL